MEKVALGFRVYKIWQILKHFGGAFCGAARVGHIAKSVGGNISRAGPNPILIHMNDSPSEKKFNFLHV